MIINSAAEFLGSEITICIFLWGLLKHAFSQLFNIPGPVPGPGVTKVNVAEPSFKLLRIWGDPNSVTYQVNTVTGSGEPSKGQQAFRRR